MAQQKRLTTLKSLVGMTNRNSGFTLIELLIAVAILSALLFTGTYAYQLMAARWDKDLGHFNRTTAVTKNINLLHDLLRGVQPFIVVENKPSTNTPAFFFIGFEDSLLSVSRSGLFSQNYPEIFRLTTVRKESGLYDLVYQSASTKQVLLLSPLQNIQFAQTITLFENVQEVNFSYFGWEDYMEYANSSETLTPASWRNKYSGIDQQLLPLQMKVELKIDDKYTSFNVNFDRRTLRYLSPYIDKTE